MVLRFSCIQIYYFIAQGRIFMKVDIIAYEVDIADMPVSGQVPDFPASNQAPDLFPNFFSPHHPERPAPELRHFGREGLVW
jgi:hypothetical protein